ncbi:unnamed protein product [Hyaloperonospora brassicae]|uniref:ELM2 domain-containing protein n=1 Tax=Hyaloperonospora brassicae TaxID=162125 RepID=A0AAV0SZN1_HYABA|nr:unnamed protein product [Hyaloperonospora brassicae]
MQKMRPEPGGPRACNVSDPNQCIAGLRRGDSERRGEKKEEELEQERVDEEAKAEKAQKEEEMKKVGKDEAKENEQVLQAARVPYGEGDSRTIEAEQVNQHGGLLCAEDAEGSDEEKARA